MKAQEVKLPTVEKQLDTIIVDLENALLSPAILFGASGIMGSFNYKDKQILDAIDARIVILVSDQSYVELARSVAEFIGAEPIFTNSKLGAVKEKLNIDVKSAFYMGGNYDSIPLLQEVGYGVAPADAEPPIVEATQKIVTNKRAGEGALGEAIRDCIKYGFLKIKSHGEKSNG